MGGRGGWLGFLCGAKSTRGRLWFRLMLAYNFPAALSIRGISPGQTELCYTCGRGTEVCTGIEYRLSNSTDLTELTAWLTVYVASLTVWLTDYVTSLTVWLTDYVTSVTVWLTDYATSLTVWLTDYATSLTVWLTDYATSLIVWLTDYVTLLDSLTGYVTILTFWFTTTDFSDSLNHRLHKSLGFFC
jgi:hypothetical protein